MRATATALFSSLLFLCLNITAHAAEPAPSPASPVPSASDTIVVTNAPDEALLAAARLLEALREQQDSNRRTIEALKEQAASARHQAEVTSARLKLIELTLSERHERELQQLQASSRQNFTIVAVVACVGLVALAVMAFFLFRATSRLAELPRALTQLATTGASASGSGRLLLAGTTSAAANERLLSVVGLLEKKFGDLEHSVEAATAAAPATALDAGGSNAKAPNGNGQSRVSQAEGQSVRVLLARGQQFLENDAPAEALKVFEEALVLHEADTDALVKRGKALEKLGRMEEALGSYDRALALDSSLTIAHLSKGGVYNRLDRFGEALECYERALKTQAAPVSTQVAA